MIGKPKNNLLVRAGEVKSRSGGVLHTERYRTTSTGALSYLVVSYKTTAVCMYICRIREQANVYIWKRKTNMEDHPPARLPKGLDLSASIYDKYHVLLLCTFVYRHQGGSWKKK